MLARLRPYRWGLVLGLCLLSRQLTAIGYIEDVDSLRFALAASEFDVATLRPHFPGYPVFCFLVRVLYTTSGSLSFSFSLMGGLSIFAIIYFSEKMVEAFWPTIKSGWLGALLFLNPFLWLMSNRYMPDLTGLAVLMAATWLFSKSWMEKGDRSLIGFGIAAGLLAGGRLSYVPFLLPAVLAVFLKKNSWRPILFFLTAGLIASLLWLIPMVVDAGWRPLLEAAQQQSGGHFNEWGGTVLSTSQSYGLRLLKMIQYTWADGLGGWWPGRHWVIPLLSGLASGVVWLFLNIKGTQGIPSKKAVVWIIAAALLTYAVWIFFFQNVLYKPRHLMPLLSFVLLLPVARFVYFYEKQKFLAPVLLAVMLIANAILTFSLVRQHQQPTAIAQAQEYLSQNSGPGDVIVSTELIGYYLDKHRTVRARCYPFEAENSIARAWQRGATLYSTARLEGVIGEPPSRVLRFYHNPYINRLWPEVMLYQYEQ